MNSVSLKQAIFRDQLRAVRATVEISLPVNTILGLAALLVAAHAKHALAGFIWFIASQIINFLRLLLCRRTFRDHAGDTAMAPASPRWSVRRHLLLHTLAALCSGIVWSFIPILCDGYTSSQTLFFLVMICGITAGAVTHGFAYALIPIAYITPPLLSVLACLLWAGGFDRYCLAATVALYLGGLIRGARVAEDLVRKESRLKNQATALSDSLATASEEARQFAHRMQESAIRDELTELLNRRGFSLAVEGLASESGNCQLLLLDLDGFKSVNDAFGHKVGDRVLTEVGRRLREATAGNRGLARLGGDEFAVIYDEADRDEPIETLAIRLIASLTIPFSQIDAGRVGVCVGAYEGPKSEIDELLVYADAALYAAKKEGRNRYRVFDEALRAEALMRRDVERELRPMLAAGALEMWYQPIVAQHGADLDSFEALLRWRHPVHGSIPASAIVDIAAQSGLSDQLLNFILAEVTRMIGALARAGVDDVRISINISPREISQIDVDELILAHCRASRLPPSKLEIEITEESLINPRATRDKLSRLRNAGVSLALDDFGTGYSSLGTLQKIRVDRVKVDRSFVTGITERSPEHSLTDAVLRLSHAFGFEVVAEGVESESDVAALSKLGCPLMQGHLFAKAMPHEEAVAWASALADSKAYSGAALPLD